MKFKHYILIIFLFSYLSSCKNDKKVNIKKEDKKEKIIKEQFVKNYLEYTEDFIDISWFKYKANIQNNVTNDPNGNPTADLIDVTADSLGSRVVQFIPDLDDGIYAFSIYLKALPGESGIYAIGADFKGEKNQWRKNLVEINDSSWTRAYVKLKKEGEGDVLVYAGYALIKGADLKGVYAWGAQLEKLESINDEIKDYSGRDVIIME